MAWEIPKGAAETCRHIRAGAYANRKQHEREMREHNRNTALAIFVGAGLGALGAFIITWGFA